MCNFLYIRNTAAVQNGKNGANFCHQRGSRMNSMNAPVRSNGSVSENLGKTRNKLSVQFVSPSSTTPEKNGIFLINFMNANSENVGVKFPYSKIFQISDKLLIQHKIIQSIKCKIIYRVFRNLWDPLRESYKYMPYLSSFMRYNEFSVT